MFLFISCDDDSKKNKSSDDVSCEDCYQYMPETIPVELVFSPLENGEIMYFTIYKGNAFTSGVYFDGQTENSIITVDLEPNQKFTVVAEYYRDSKSYYVINDCYPRTKYFKKACDKPCHYVFETKCDLKLKKL